MSGWLGESPRLGVLGERPMPPALMRVLTEARRWCAIVPLPAGPVELVDAVVATGPAGLPVPPPPLAVWAESMVEVEQAETAGAAVVLSLDDEVIERAGARGLLVPPANPPGSGPADVMGRAVPVAVFVRARLRGARDLPSPLVIEHDGNSWQRSGASFPLDGELGETALACASVAIVVGPTIIEALAWATPCVTDTKTAAAVGAHAETDVLVADDVAGRRQRAEEVATDESLAARLSWAGRRLVETRHSPALVAARLVRRLGLGAAGLAGPAPLAAQLGDLGTSAGAVIVDRVRAATSVLPARG